MASTSRMWREEFVAEAFALRRALDEAGDVHEFNRRRDDDVGFGDFCEQLEPRVRHGDDADVRVNGAEGIIRRLGLARARDGVEQGGFAHVGQSDDSSFEHNLIVVQMRCAGDYSRSAR